MSRQLPASFADSVSAWAKVNYVSKLPPGGSLWSCEADVRRRPTRRSGSAHQLDERRDVPLGRRLVADQWVVDEPPQRGGVDPLCLDRPLDLAVYEGAEPRLEQIERLADPFVIGCRHVVRSLDRRAPCFPGSSRAWRSRGTERNCEEGKSSGVTVMVSALLLRSPAHPAPPSTDAASMSSAAGVSDRRTACTTAPRPATARRAARRTSHTTRRLSAEPVVPPPVQAPKVSCSVPRPSGAARGWRRGVGAPDQACSTSNAARLRASLLNSTPIRWIGSPRSRYLSA